MGSAWATDKAAEMALEGGDPGVFGNPETWVAVAFVIFVVLLGKILWTRITALLDKRTADITRALGEAERLRDEALKAKADAERTLAEAAAEAEGIVGQAREEAQRMQVRAAQKLEAAAALREQQALDRIAQAESNAAKHVRDTAIDVALSATRALMRDQVGGGKTQALVDEAIGELPRRLH
jgi:F-type H+-transporting ATPase subunit b